VVSFTPRQLNGYQGAFTLGVKQPGRKADHTPPSNAEVNNASGHTSTPPIRLHGLIKQEVRLHGVVLG
jgi:hypothetical protein